MKSLLTLPLLMVLLTACEPSPTSPVPDAVDSTETVESSLCNTNCTTIHHYYCDPGATHCGDCGPFNAIACYPEPATGNYSKCGGECSAGSYVTQYTKQTYCNLQGTPTLYVSCTRPDAETWTFAACGLTCPSGFSRIATWYNSQCDPVCAMSDDCTDTSHNAMRCDRTP